MIEATRLNGSKVVVNADLIEMVEATPDTLISLTTGRKIMVREPIEEVVRRTVEYRAKVNSASRDIGARDEHGPGTTAPLGPRRG